jgi:hypothetical protein
MYILLKEVHDLALLCTNFEIGKAYRRNDED